MRILAVIPARGGSKRLPGKNVRLLGGRPLITWSIDVVSGIPEVVGILVTTDAPGIAEVAKSAGALVPWLRPAELATDAASSVDVCLHALQWYEENVTTVDGLLLLQPTSPFRSRCSVMRGIQLFRDCRKNIIGLSPAASHPMWCYRVNGTSMQPFVGGLGLEMRSQDLPPAYALNGAFYLCSPDKLRTSRSFTSGAPVPLIMSDIEESIDIDTEWDWQVAEAVIRSRSGDQA